MRQINILIAAMFIIGITTVSGFSGEPIHKLFSYQKKADVFFIYSNLLTNSWVQYSVKLTNSNQLAGSKPVIVYRYYPKSGNGRKLNWVENGKAYGIQSQAKRSGRLAVMYLKAYPSLKFTIKMRGSRAVAYTTFNGKTVIVHKIYANGTKNAIGVPSVVSVTLIGTDVRTGKVVNLRIK